MWYTIVIQSPLSAEPRVVADSNMTKKLAYSLLESFSAENQTQLFQGKNYGKLIAERGPRSKVEGLIPKGHYYTGDCNCCEQPIFNPIGVEHDRYQYGKPLCEVCASGQPLERLKSVRSLAERFAGQDCTLDGQQASILGRQSPFAVIAHLKGALRVEFSWQAVANVMAKGGNFASM